MKIVFFSNFMSHHQLPLCQALERSAGSFHFVASKPMPDKKLNLGYGDMNNLAFVIRAYEANTQEQIQRLLLDSDVVIFGDGSESYIPLRMADSKLSFLYSERFFKKGFWQKFRPTTRRRIIRKTAKYNGLPYHILCAGAYVARDAHYFNFQNLLFRWAYFPAIEHINIEHTVAQKRDQGPIKLIWVGRLLPWKRPGSVIRLAHKLKNLGLNFQLEMIGSGKMAGRLRAMIHKNNLQDRVTLSGSVPADTVREKMKRASIFLLSSDYHEGWGAVLNEAMGSGCCCIASNASGASATLIKHGENGFLYDFRDIEALTQLCEKAIKDQALRETLAINAYQTVAKCWNAEFAAKRFIRMAQCLLDDQAYSLPADGPCSLALEI